MEAEATELAAAAVQRSSAHSSNRTVRTASGRRARPRLRPAEEVAPGATEEELAAAATAIQQAVRVQGEDEAAQEEAAAKLQAIQRGRQARRDLARGGRRWRGRGGRGGSEAPPVEMPEGPEEEAAAAKLQAIQRGRQARRDLAQGEEGDGEAAAEGRRRRRLWRC